MDTIALILWASLWLGTFISIITSIVRALNIGYQKEMYILSSLSCLPLIYNSYQMNSNQLIILNVFYLIIALMGVYKWTNIKK